jgi:Cu+-exporting ATPase
MRVLLPIPLSLLLLLLLLLATPIRADDAAPADPGAVARAFGTANGLCPVMGNPVKARGGRVEYRGETIGFCCPGCIRKFQNDPVRYMDAMRADPAKYGYTARVGNLATLRGKAAELGVANGVCPVLGRPVTADGGTASYRSQTIAFCCPGCKPRFEADPETFMRELRADPGAFAYDRPGPSNAEMRAAREAAGTANGRCPVLGPVVEKAGGFVEYQGERIGFCCESCIEKFRADPERYMAPMRAEPGPHGYLRTVAR